MHTIAQGDNGQVNLRIVEGHGQRIAIREELSEGTWHEVNRELCPLSEAEITYYLPTGIAGITANGQETREARLRRLLLGT